MYGNFAEGYHSLMKDNDYKAVADFYENIFKKYSRSPSLVLDLGCGSGILTAIMAKRGYDMIGVDISAEMLDIATKENAGKNILYLCQDMREFELYGTVDVIYSSFDCLNYITSLRDLKKVFKLCANYLDPGGLFIFDVNTPYYFENVLDKKAYVLENNDTYLVWQSELNKRNGICDFYLDMFYKRGDKYERYFEKQQERAYSSDELKKISAGSGFEILNVFSSPDLKKLTPTSERAFFVLKNQKQ